MINTRNITRTRELGVFYQIVLAITAFILLIDFLGFIAWSVSGQKPVDNFHAGIITETIINLIK